MNTVFVRAFVMTFVGAMAFASEPSKPPAGNETFHQKIGQTTVAFDMVRVPPGTTHVKDSDGNERDISINSFWIGRTEVTWNEFDVWYLGLDLSDPKMIDDYAAKTRPSKVGAYINFGVEHDGYPVLCVSLKTAQDYCVWLSEKTGRKFRLPTEAEWEYACRAGQTDGAMDSQTLGNMAWYKDNSRNEEDNLATHPVAQKRPNAWGLYDMLGNVAEWIDNGDGERVVKGGSFKHSDRMANSRLRLPYTENWQMQDCQLPKSKWWYSDGQHCGFRVVCDD